MLHFAWLDFLKMDIYPIANGKTLLGDPEGEIGKFFVIFHHTLTNLLYESILAF